MRRLSAVALMALVAGCGLPSPMVSEQTAAVTSGTTWPSPPPIPREDCWRLMFLPAPWMDGPPRNFDWPGPSPWKGKQGWVVVEIDAATGYKQVYGLQHGPTYDEDQLIFWDLEPTNSEIAQLQALPDTLHCPQFPHLNIEMGQIGAGEPPADDGNPFPGAIAACVPHAVFTQVDATCAAGPPPAPCVPRKCSPFMRGTVPDGCGGELCCQPAGSKGHYCE